MPLKTLGLAHYGSTIDKKIQGKIDKVFSMLDQKIDELSKAKGLSVNQVKILQPLHCCVLVGDTEVFVVLAVHNVGETSILNFFDWSGKEMNMESAIFLAERDLALKNVFGFKFRRSVLDFDDDQKEAAITQIATRYIEGEIMNAEKLRSRLKTLIFI